MQKDTALNIVRVLSVLEWLSAAFCFVLAGLLIFAGPFFARELATDPQLAAQLDGVGAVGGETVLTVVFILFGVFFLVLAILSLITGFGLWKLKNWGRILCLVLSWIGAVWAVFSLIASFFEGSAAGIVQGVLTNLVSIALSAVYIWLLQFEPTVVGLFSQEPAKDVRGAKKT